MSPPPQAKYPPPPAAPLLVRLLRLALLSFIGLSLLALLLAATFFTLQLALADRIAPGVRIGDVDIGGMARAGAAEALSARYSDVEEAVYTFRDGDRSWSASASELGLRLPAAELADHAYAIGRRWDGSPSLPEQAEAWFYGAYISLILRFDEAVARAYLERLARDIDRERQDASLVFNGLGVDVSAGRSGRELDVAATLIGLRDAILSGEGGREIPLAINESPPRGSNVEQAAALAQVALSSPLQLVATRPNGEPLMPWLVTPEQIRAGLAITVRDEGDDRRYDVRVDLSAYARFLGTLSAALSTPAVDGRFDFDPASGQLRVISPSSAGRRLNVERTIERLEAAVFDPVNRRVSMAFETL